jgi:hypothetical protein
MAPGTLLALALVARVAFEVSDGGDAPVTKGRGFDASVVLVETQASADAGSGVATAGAPAVPPRVPRVIVVQNDEMVDAPAPAVAPRTPVSAADSRRLRAKRLAEARTLDSAVRVTVVGPDGRVETRTIRMRRP